ncbi:MAG: hypothetical protein AAF957_02330 [Planctomycetota bacterium]
MAALSMLDWELARPIALGLLVLPIALVVLSFRKDVPRIVVIGTTRFFGDEEAKGADRARRRLTASRLAALLAMLVGTLAATGPRPVPGADPPEIYVARVDRSPSMFLPIDPARPGGDRRIDVAIGRARDWLVERDRTGGVRALVRWADAGGSDGSPPLAAGDAPPSRLLEAPRAPAAEPLWSGLDRPGTLLVTDAVPDVALQHAGLFTSGGPAVPGPVAADASGLLAWTGAPDAPLERSSDGPGPTVWIDAAAPGALVDFVRIWAEERAVAVVDEPGRAGLVVAHRPGGEPGGEFGGGPSGARVLDAGRDGWTARVSVTGAPEIAPGFEPWLVAADGTPLITVRPGEVNVHAVALDPAPTDDRTFAVSAARMLDAALLPPPEVVSIDERRAAGSARSEAPRTPPERVPAVDVEARTRAERGRRAETWCAALAAALALAAFVLRLRGSP